MYATIAQDCVSCILIVDIIAAVDQVDTCTSHLQPWFEQPRRWQRGIDDRYRWDRTNVGPQWLEVEAAIHEYLVDGRQMLKGFQRRETPWPEAEERRGFLQILVSTCTSCILRRQRVDKKIQGGRS